MRVERKDQEKKQEFDLAKAISIIGSNGKNNSREQAENGRDNGTPNRTAISETIVTG